MRDVLPHWDSPPLPDAEAVQRALERVYQEGQYELTPPGPDGGGADEFFRPLKERFWDPLVAWWRDLEGAVPWIDDLLAGLVLCAVVALVVQMLRLRRTDSATTLPAKPSGATRPDEVHALAQAAGERGEYAVAARLLLQAVVLRLETAERRVNRPGVTNRELQQRYRSTPLARPLTTLVETIDRGWFGGRPCTELDYVDCLAAHNELAAAARTRAATAPAATR